MEHQEMELVLQSIHMVMIFVQMQPHLKYDQFLLLQLMLVKIVHQHKHLKVVEWIEFVQYKHEQLHEKLSRNIFFNENIFFSK
jgi:hypothetical protein